MKLVRLIKIFLIETIVKSA